MSQIAVLKTRPQGEASAENDLLRHGADAFVPRQFETRTTTRSKRPRILTRILCPGYVFTHFDTREALSALVYDLKNRERPDVHSVLGTIREDELDPLRAVNGNQIVRDPPPFVVEEGKTYQVLHGPFAGQNVKVEAIRGSSLCVRLHRFRATISIDHLRPNGTG